MTLCVVDMQSNGIFLGTIGRKILTTLLYHDQYYVSANNGATSHETWSESSGRSPPAEGALMRRGEKSEAEEDEE